MEKLPFTLNCRGRLLSLEKPLVMGILNLTPDSFSDGGKFQKTDQAMKQVEKMLEEGACIIDIGGYSSRPGANHIAVEEEIERIYGVTNKVLDAFPEAIISVDTFRSKVAKEMLELGVHIINDISAGQLDPEMHRVVAAYEAPYILMHMQGKPQNMQDNPSYKNVVEEVWSYFVERVEAARSAGIKDIILDPGFGFGKNLSHNYILLNHLKSLNLLDLPLLAGVSRKSMIWKLLDKKPNEVLPWTCMLNAYALDGGARILRVHDVKEAMDTIRLHSFMQSVAHEII